MVLTRNNGERLQSGYLTKDIAGWKDPLSWKTDEYFIHNFQGKDGQASNHDFCSLSFSFRCHDALDVKSIFGYEASILLYLSIIGIEFLFKE